jgi:tetratricopeptide (TPR) repeat protein
LKTNPYNRNALAGEADAQLRMRDPAALAAALKVVALDPSNQLATRALGQAYSLAGQADSAKKYLARADTGLALDISVTQFLADSAGADLSGIATNVKGTASGPAHLTFEFLDAHGAVLGTQAAQIAPIPPSGTAQFEVKAGGKGIVGWRYKMP